MDAGGNRDRLYLQTGADNRQVASVGLARQVAALEIACVTCLRTLKRSADELRTHSASRCSGYGGVFCQRVPGVRPAAAGEILCTLPGRVPGQGSSFDLFPYWNG